MYLEPVFQQRELVFVRVTTLPVVALMKFPCRNNGSRKIPRSTVVDHGKSPFSRKPLLPLQFSLVILFLGIILACTIVQAAPKVDMKNKCRLP